VVIAEQFDVSWQARPPSASQLARSEQVAGRILALVLDTGCEADDWPGFAVEFLAALPGIPPEQRPQLVLFCGPHHRDRIRKHRLSVSEIWWWGVHGRLDSTLAAARALGDDTDPLRAACIAEICGFDLALCESLAAEWDGGMASLLRIVEESRVTSTTHVDAVRLRGAAEAVPRAVHHADWDAGLIDAWDHFDPFVSPVAIPSSEREEVLHTRLWRGQLRELMPLVDEERARLETWVRPIMQAGVGVDFPVEIGLLQRLICHDQAIRPRSDRTRRDAVTWLRDTRNLLAHRTALSSDRIHEGFELLDRDRAPRDSIG